MKVHRTDSLRYQYARVEIIIVEVHGCCHVSDPALALSL